MVHDLKVVKCEGAHLGLSLNHVKSEVMCKNKDIRVVVLSSLRGAKVVEPNNATLLKCSIGDDLSVSLSLGEKLTNWQ